MLKDILYTCFILMFVVFLFFLVRGLWRDAIVEMLGLKCAKFLGFRKWEHYEDEFGSGDEKTIIHLRICQYIGITQIYDYEKKKFVNYVD